MNLLLPCHRKRTQRVAWQWGTPPPCHSALHIGRPSLWGYWARAGGGGRNDTQASGRFRTAWGTPAPSPLCPSRTSGAQIGGPESYQEQACFTDQEQLREQQSSPSSRVRGGRRVRGRG